MIAVSFPRIGGGSDGLDGLSLAILGLLILSCAASFFAWSFVRRKLELVERTLLSAPRPWRAPSVPSELSPDAPTAVLFVDGYSMLGLRSLLEIREIFSGTISQVVFVSMVRGDDSEEMRSRMQRELDNYVGVAHLMDWAASARVLIGEDVRERGHAAAVDLADRFPRTTFFLARLLFKPSRWYFRWFEDRDARPS